MELGKLFCKKSLEKGQKMKEHTDMGIIGFLWLKEGDCNQEEKNSTSNEISELFKLEGLVIEGIFIHFADADNKEFTHSQINKFNEAVEYMKKTGINFKIAHATASMCA